MSSAIALVAAIAIAVAGCGGNDEEQASQAPATPAATDTDGELPRGGTLRIAEPGPPPPDFPAWDPQKAFPGEFARCCLWRTLLSTNGRPTGEGGTVLRPDTP